MKKIFYLLLVITSTNSFGQNQCKLCDSLLQLQRQTGSRLTLDKYKLICLKRDTLFSDTTFSVTTRAICSDYMSFETFLSKTRIPTSGFRIENKDTIFFQADKMPVYLTGEAEMIKFIRKNIVYPKRCIEKKIQGKVYVTFVIDENGIARDVYPLVSPDPDLANEAVRVVKSLHTWIPAKRKGKPVKFQFNLPINFTL